MTTGYQVIARALADLGVGTVHGLMGDGNLHFIQSFVHDEGRRYVAARHEAGAVNMADGHARVLAPGALGVATVTHGPGLTNAMTALTAAVRNRTPLLLVAGDLPRPAFRHNQRIDQAAVVAPTGAGYVSATVSAGAGRQVESAIRMALFQRRPVVLDIANDVQLEEWSGGARIAQLRSILQDTRSQRRVPDAAAVADAARRLEAARRPLLLAGRGAVRAGAGPQLRALAARTGALLATTLLAKGLFAGDPCDLGVTGTFGSALSTAILADADCVIAFGASLHTWTTSVGQLYPKASLIQVDVRDDDIGDFTAVDHVVLGDAALTAAALLDSVAARLPGEGFRTPRITEALAAWRPEDEVTDASGGGRVDPRLALIALNRMLPRDRLVFSDGGHFWSYPAAYLDVPDPDSFVLAANFGSIGLGLATAIGGALARPDRLPVLVVGDGGFLMSIAELETAVRYQVPLVVVVLNDGAYGSEVHALRASGLPTQTAQFPDTDFVRLAAGFGAAGLTVRDLTDLEYAADLISGLDGPLVLDVKIDPDLVAPWFRAAKLRSAAPAWATASGATKGP
jgi:acetolactate synthase I/II/III large subunit